MRTEKELWEVVLSRPDLFDKGLCIWLIICRISGKLSQNEFVKLHQIVTNNRPALNIKTYWIGKFGEIQPRIDWINERIKQL